MSGPVIRNYSPEVDALAEVLGDIRVTGARQADWWTDDAEHGLLIRALRAECLPWAEGLLASDWLASRLAEARAAALREAAEAADRAAVTGLETTRPDLVARWLRNRAERIARAVEAGETDV